MASGYHRAVVANRPAAAETAPTATTNCVARTRYSLSRRRVARKTHSKGRPCSPPEAGRTRVRPWATARITTTRPARPPPPATATDRRSGLVTHERHPDDHRHDEHQGGIGRIEGAFTEGGRHHQSGHDARARPRASLFHVSESTSARREPKHESCHRRAYKPRLLDRRNFMTCGHTVPGQASSIFVDARCSIRPTGGRHARSEDSQVTADGR